MGGGAGDGPMDSQLRTGFLKSGEIAERGEQQRAIHPNGKSVKKGGPGLKRSRDRGRSSQEYKKKKRRGQKIGQKYLGSKKKKRGNKGGPGFSQE